MFERFALMLYNRLKAKFKYKGESLWNTESSLTEKNG